MATNKELFKWSRVIVDACLRTGIKPEEVETACAAYVRAKNGKQTNYEKYFGSPEKAANQVIKVKEGIIDNVTYELGIESGKRIGKIYENATEESYLEWLQEECDE